MRHQKLHLITQDAAVAQNEVFPQAGDIRCVQQRHVGLLGRAAAFAVVARSASGHHIHPVVWAFLTHGDNVLTRQNRLMESATAIGAHTAVSRKQFGIGQARTQIKRVDAGHTLGADDAVDGDHRLLARDGVVAPAKNGHLTACFPADIVSGVMGHRLLQRDPRLGQPLGREFQDLHTRLLMTVASTEKQEWGLAHV